MPTNANLARFFEIGGVLCPLGFYSLPGGQGYLVQYPIGGENEYPPILLNSLGTHSTLFLSPGLFVAFLSLGPKNDFMLFGAILYDGIWKLRNQVYFESASTPPPHTPSL